MNESQTVGDLVQDGKRKALKSIAVTLSLVVYVGMLVYSFVHNYNLMARGVPADMLIWAMLGVVGLELTAIALPLTLHWWAHSNLQRFAALGFYALDLGIMFANVVLSFSLTAGDTIPEWLALYLQYAMPATPVICGVGWTLLWLLDPSHRAEQNRESLREATREQIAGRMAQAARGPAVNAMVDSAAQAYAWQIIQETLGADPALLGGGKPPALLLAGPGREANGTPAGFGMGAYDPQPWAQVTPAAITRPAAQPQQTRLPIWRARPGNGKKPAEAQAPAPDLAKLLEGLRALGVDPAALAALLATQPAGMYSLDVDGVGTDRPNAQGGGEL